MRLFLIFQCNSSSLCSRSYVFLYAAFIVCDSNCMKINILIKILILIAWILMILGIVPYQFHL
jgi:hypothetical protein